MKGIPKSLLTPCSKILWLLLVWLAVQFSPLAKAAPANAKSTSNSPPKLNIQETPLNREVKAATSFAPVVKKVAPSVVNIYSTMTIRERPTPNPFFDDPFFRRFFGDRFGEQFQP